MRKIFPLIIATICVSPAALAAEGTNKEATPPVSGGVGTTVNAVMGSQGAARLTVTNKLIDGKKVWLPSELKVKSGDHVQLTLVNTLSDPHGFNAPGLADKVVVGGNETKMVTFVATRAGEVKFDCQLHPAHVGGKITVE